MEENELSEIYHIVIRHHTHLNTIASIQYNCVIRACKIQAQIFDH